jgi:hypothetical protein
MKNPIEIYILAERKLFNGANVETAQWLRWVMDESWDWMTAKERIYVSEFIYDRRIKRKF